MGRSPTRIGAPTISFELEAMRVTVSSNMFTTQTLPASTTAATAPFPTGIAFPTDAPDCGSILATVSSSRTTQAPESLTATATGEPATSSSSTAG
jgi:hypothetical protein